MFYANASKNMFLLSGRLRISVQGLKGNGKLAERISRMGLDVQGIKKAAANVYTGNALVLFDESVLDAPAIVRLIEQMKHQAEYGDSYADQGETAPNSRSWLLTGAGLIAAGAAGALLPHSVLGRNGVLPGAAALALGVPLAREGYRYWKKTRKVHYSLLLLLVALISVLIGQSSFGLLAVLTGTITGFLERLFARRRIRSEPPLKLKSVERAYRRLAPPALLAAGIYYAATGYAIVPLAMLVLVFPYMLYPAARATVRRAVEQGAARGILVRNPAKLEACRHINTVILASDTLLTSDSYRVESVISAESFSKNRVVALAASCLQDTGSPFVQALADEARRRNIKLMPVDHLEFAGRVCGMIDGEEVCFGTKTQLAGKYAFNVRMAMQERKIIQLGQYPMFVAYGQKIRGLIGVVCDDEKTGMEMVERLRETGVDDFWLFSRHDDALTAFIARSFCIDRWTSNAARDDICTALQKMNKEGQSTAMLCLNDCAYSAPADLVIRVADGAAMDQGADIVVQSPALAADSVDLGKYTSEKFAQNGIVSTGIDVVGLILLLTMNMSPYGALLYKTAGNGALLAFADRSFRYSKEDKEYGRTSRSAALCAC